MRGGVWFESRIEKPKLDLKKMIWKLITGTLAQRKKTSVISLILQSHNARESLVQHYIMTIFPSMRILHHYALRCMSNKQGDAKDFVLQP